MFGLLMFAAVTATAAACGGSSGGVTTDAQAQDVAKHIIRDMFERHPEIALGYYHSSMRAQAQADFAQAVRDLDATGATLMDIDGASWTGQSGMHLTVQVRYRTNGSSGSCKGEIVFDRLGKKLFPVSKLAVVDNCLVGKSQ